MLCHLVSGPNTMKDCTVHVHKGTMIIQTTELTHPVTNGHIPIYPNKTPISDQDKVCACMCKLEM
jgi:hypothetical protein